MLNNRRFAAVASLLALGIVTALDATIPYSQPMEEYILPDVDKIVGAVQQVLGQAPVTA